MIDAPDAFLPAFLRAWHARDGSAIGALFTPDGDFVNVTGLWWHGPDKIAAPHQYALDSFFAETTLRPGRTEIKDLGDTAIVRARLHLTGQTAPDGTPAQPRQTIMTFVLIRTDAGWLATSAQNTDVVPGQETHLARENGLHAVDYRR
ncbi:YybH family protein [Tropicibacter naphthalenivorans]|uniref:SnoaL-like domain protein n=1 Tax=Tropicibacter naphthalenivorans TaxID=441103 RepID=A0A0P1G289_9RHOB|nr:SgcJ/EcaC family oxidoreductase [Tropicibacter naphthalenivorans]CUH75788.1 SnoaL-like domain protein [Tropicibacter naphthalenivorans]SMC42242.1 conserved hypothetical protein [Tropicibacter naphthalenivorans]